MSNPFLQVVSQYGSKPVVDLTALAMGASAIFSLKPGHVLQLITEAPQADRDAVKTPRQFFELLLTQFNKLVRDGLDDSDAKVGADIEVSLDCAPDLYSAVQTQARELQAEADGAGYAAGQKGPVFVMPGNGTLN